MSFVGRKYCLSPNQNQQSLMRQYCGATRFIYNRGLRQRQAWYQIFGRSLNYVAQAKHLKSLRNDSDFDWLKTIPAQVLQQSLIDLEAAYQRFFSGLGEYPRFKIRGRRDSFRVPQHVQVEKINKRWGRVKLQGLGWIKFRLHRPIAGQVKSATVTFKAGKWKISFIVEQAEQEQKINNNPAVGIDLGVAHALTSSNGDFYDSEPWTENMRMRLRRLERKLAQQQPGSVRHQKTKLIIAQLHHQAKNRRADFNHKTSHYLAKNFGLVAMENLNTKNMTKSAKGTIQQPGTNVAQKCGLNKAILNIGWQQLKTFIEYKCQREGSILVLVPAHFSSQECSKCHHIAKANRERQAQFVCLQCDHADHADINAAQIIKQRGITLVRSAGGKSAAARGGYLVVNGSYETRTTQLAASLVTS